MSTSTDPQMHSSTSDTNGHALRTRFSRLSDQVGRSNFWRGTAHPELVSENSWELFAKRLAKRRSPKSVDHICQSDGTSLAWGLNVSQLPPQTFDLLQLTTLLNGNDRPNSLLVTSVFSNWLSAGDSEPQSVDFSLQCLAIANLLPQTALLVDRDLWWAMLDAVAEIVHETYDWHIDPDVASQHALAHQLLAGELPLTLSYQLSEMRPLYKLRIAAQDTLTEGLMEFLNGAGLPKASYLPVFRGLMACWTRSRTISAVANKGFWSSKAEQQFRWAITKSICLSGTTGAALLCDEQVPAWSPDFIAGMLRIAGKPTDRTAALDLFDKKITSRIVSRGGKHVPEFSESCEWAGLAVLRTELHRKKAVLAIDFSTPDMKLDFWSGPHRLLFGTWAGETTISGTKWQAVGNWEETCWFSDSDVDYVEFSIDLEQGARLERQVLLARKDKFLLLVDNVMNVPSDSVQHRFSLPLGQGIGFVPETETREGTLMASKPLARVLPLGLPEWRTDPRIGDLTSVGAKLQLVHERQGKNHSCPLFFDLDPKRSGKRCTWRQLTVAEALKIQPPEVAAGYRIQCGKDQWLVYRSLEAPANRTVLGYNLSIEGVVGRFSSKTGTVEELLQVEG